MDKVRINTCMWRVYYSGEKWGPRKQYPHLWGLSPESCREKKCEAKGSQQVYLGATVFRRLKTKVWQPPHWENIESNLVIIWCSRAWNLFNSALGFPSIPVFLLTLSKYYLQLNHLNNCQVGDIGLRCFIDQVPLYLLFKITALSLSERMN